ncbi:hypothetical protein CSA37_08070 [Candidatus Fermentibacteria bacterium]|nr:MAG: hypothetical protein CSA37_11580 [Candidatus Fermentibacteria bacterium]PIE52112.1 MAG: hypothetical protein CSA37_08070 [Candidatus Fermentibacteria bacterium]
MSSGDGQTGCFDSKVPVCFSLAFQLQNSFLHDDLFQNSFQMVFCVTVLAEDFFQNCLLLNGLLLNGLFSALSKEDACN